MSARTVIAFVAGVALCGALTYGFFHARPEPGASSRLSSTASGETPEAALTPEGNATTNPSEGDVDQSHSKSKARSVESILFANGSIHVERANDVIGGESFDTFLQQLESEGATDLEARELSKAYEASLTEAIKQPGTDLHLSKIACGLSICGADLSSPTENQDRFSLIMNSGEKSGARIYSAVTSLVPTRDGTFSYRIIFSTDPSGSTLQVPRRPIPVPRTEQQALSHRKKENRSQSRLCGGKQGSESTLPPGQTRGSAKGGAFSFSQGRGWPIGEPTPA